MTEVKDEAPILKAVEQAEKKQVITSDTLYTQLVDEPTNKELSGIKAMKDFHLKNAETYDKDLKEKIFFIG